MKKKIYSAIIAAMMIICTTLCVTAVSFGGVGASGYSDGFGNKLTVNLELPRLGKDTYLGGVKKCFSDDRKGYSKFGVNRGDSTINKMNVWLCNSKDGSGIQSAKYIVLPDGNIVTLNYKYSNAFPVGSTVYFYGEQHNVNDLFATAVMYSY